MTGLATAAVLISLAVAAWWLVRPSVRRNILWRAANTPLASIIGSGFLIIGPVLEQAFGAFAPAGMAALCATAYAFGWAIRRNIARIGSTAGPRTAAEEALDRLSSWALMLAYVISVAYYLNLFGAFAARLGGTAVPIDPKIVTTGALLVILALGATRGFGALERAERIAVGIKLAVIAGLFGGLIVFFGEKAATGGLLANPAETRGWPAATLLFGLIVTVQGFETSRYLGAEYPAPIRIRSMRLAQLLSGAIYMAYILLISYVFPHGSVAFSETAIIDMMGMVAPLLPALLIVSALSAQFSAAVADTEGAGGLAEELSRGVVTERAAYAALTAVGIAMTWASDVFEIISYASRAFALYYAIQCAVAVLGLRAERAGAAATLGAAALAALAVAITIFGTPVE